MGLRTRATTLIMARLAVGGVAWADTWVVFSKDEAAVIQGYYAQHPADVGQGKSQGRKGKPLPPGIARNLACGKPLPPGIAKQRLPDELVRQLPPVQVGYERV